MYYPIAIEPGDERTAYGVIVPDLPGCFSAGDSLEEAVENAREAIELHLEGLLHDKKDIPAPSEIGAYMRREEFAGYFWATVPVDLSALRSATKRYNITMPERVMAMIDTAASQVGESRSAYLARAAIDRIESGILHQRAMVVTDSANDDKEISHSA